MRTTARRRNLLAGLAAFCLAALTLSSLVLQTHAGNGIYVSAVKPASTNPGTAVHVYGRGATPGGMVYGQLEWPYVSLFSISMPMNNSSFNESTYTLWNGPYILEPVPGQGVPFNGSIIEGLSNWSVPIIVTPINGSYFNVFNSGARATVNITLTSQDGLPHKFWVLYTNGSSTPQTNDPVSAQFTGTLNFSFVATSTIGTYKYECAIHDGSMYGYFNVVPTGTIPEFQPFVMLSLLAAGTLVAALVYKRKREG